MWNGKRLAVILPTYNEHLSIAACIRGFESLGIVDEVLVVNNNAHPDTSGQVALTTAREVMESTQGYDAAIKRGFAEIRTFDLICVCEPDGTFDPADLLKLLPYTHDVDVVFGSRTTQALILSGANMGWFLKWGNWAVAKLVEVLYNTVFLSDVGCTYRVIHRESLDRIEPKFAIDGSSFGLEMMLHVAREKMTFVQVPVKYQERVGESSVTGSRYKSIVLGLQMIVLCVRMRVRRPSVRP